MCYDGASTMSGRFSGLQSRVKELNPLALYIHCCAQNLNLVLIDSIRSSVETVLFFVTLETLYTFLSSKLMLPPISTIFVHEALSYSLHSVYTKFFL